MNFARAFAKLSPLRQYACVGAGFFTVTTGADTINGLCTPKRLMENAVSSCVWPIPVAIISYGRATNSDVNVALTIETKRRNGLQNSN